MANASTATPHLGETTSRLLALDSSAQLARNKGLRRLRLTVLPYAIGLSAAYVGLALGAVKPWAAYLLSAWCSLSLLTIYVLLKSHSTLRSPDPSLTFPQVLCGCVAVVISYTAIDVARGLALLWLCLLMLFDINRLSVRQLLMASFGSLSLMALATALHDHLHEGRIDAVSEWVSLGMGAVIMPVMRLVSLKSYHWRSQMLAQRTQLAETVTQLAEASVRDALTGLINRRHMQNLLDSEWRRLRRTGQPFCFAILDLDHFKHINDAHGHAVGDAVLSTFGHLSTTQLPATDLLARWGGEEFLLLMPETPLDVARKRLDLLQDSLRLHNWSALANDLSVSFSAGLCQPQGDGPLHRQLERADRALYRAKAEGRGRTVEAESA